MRASFQPSAHACIALVSASRAVALSTCRCEAHRLIVLPLTRKLPCAAYPLYDGPYRHLDVASRRKREITALPRPEKDVYQPAPVFDVSELTMASSCAWVSTSFSDATSGAIVAIHDAIRAGSSLPSVPTPP